MTARLILTVMGLVFFIGWLAGDIVISSESSKPDYEAQANCIAEYDYQHHNNATMSNLVVALKKCQR